MKKTILLSLLALAACATPESRMQTGLIQAGLSRPVAKCMAQRMVDRLSVTQLMRLQSLSSLRGERIGQLTVSELMHRVRALGDPKILEVVSTAGLGCAIAS